MSAPPEGALTTSLDVVDVTIDGHSVIGACRKVVLIFDTNEVAKAEVTLMGSIALDGAVFAEVDVRQDAEMTLESVEAFCRTKGLRLVSAYRSMSEMATDEANDISVTGVDPSRESE